MDLAGIFVLFMFSFNPQGDIVDMESQDFETFDMCRDALGQITTAIPDPKLKLFCVPKEAK